MTLRGEMHDRIHGVLAQGRQHPVVVADVRVDKAEVGLPLQAVEVGEVAGIGERIVGDQPVLRVAARPVVDEIGTDKAGGAGYQQRLTHLCISFCSFSICRNCTRQ